MKVAIIGAGLAGISAAIYAKKAGFDVDVYEKNSTPGGKLWQWKSKGFTFDMGPSMIIERWIIDEVLRVAKKPKLEFQEVNPLFSLWYENKELVANRNNIFNLIKELSLNDFATFKKESKKMETVIKHVRKSFFQKPVDGFKGVMNLHLLRIASLINPNLSATEYAKKKFKNEIIKALMSTYPSYTEHPIQKSPAIAVFVPYLMMQEGIYYPKGGIYKISDAMYAAAKDMGVKFHFNTPIKKIIQKNRKIISIRSKNDIKADVFISAIDYNHTQNLIHKNTTDKKAAHAYFGIAIGIKKKLPFTHHTFLIPKDYETSHKIIDNGKLPKEYPLYLCVASKTDKESCPKNSENLFVVGVLPSTQELNWKKTKNVVFENALNQIKRQTGTDLKKYLVTKKIFTPDNMQEKFNNTGGSVFGLSGIHNPFVGFREYNKDKSIRNLYYCGSTVQPGNGVPLVIRSGKFAVDLIKDSI